MNKNKKSVWQDSHERVNCRPSARKPFAEWILTLKDVAEAGDFFFHKRTGMFDAMPACWKHLKEDQRREVAALCQTFYNEALVDPSKKPWGVDNIKRYLGLGYVKLDDLFKFRAAYLASLQDDSIFMDPVPEDSTTEAASTSNGHSALLDEHDGFALKPKALIKEYQENRGDSDAQGKLFRHMANFAATQHVVQSKRSQFSVQLEPTPGLDVEMSATQRKLLNPTVKDVQLSELIDKAQGKGSKKKEAKRRHDIMTGNIASFSAILNDPKKLELIEDYNDVAVSLEMYNAEKEVMAEASKKKKSNEAAEKAKNKADKESKEAQKQNELLPGFQQEIREKDASEILKMSDKRMRLYIRYFFKQKVVNIGKKNKGELQGILAPLLEDLYSSKAPSAESVDTASQAAVEGDDDAGDSVADDLC